jgi:hypothetical protein
MESQVNKDVAVTGKSPRFSMRMWFCQGTGETRFDGGNEEKVLPEKLHAPAFPPFFKLPSVLHRL